MEDQQNSNLNHLRFQQQFFQLQHHWNHYKSSSATMLHNDSPPEHDLISALQRHGTATFSTSSGWKIHTNELAQDEIRRERRAAIASGEFRGRRLSYNDIDLGNNFLHGGYCDDQNDHALVPPIQSSDSGEDFTENRKREFGRRKEQVPVYLNALSYSSASSSSSSSSSLLGKKSKEQMAMAAKVEENVTQTIGEKRETGNWCKLGKWELGLALLVTASASVVMLIFSVCFLGFGAYDEEQLPFLLIPT